MKTICLESKPCSSIGGGIRLDDSGVVYTTLLTDSSSDILRKHNLLRFNKEVVSLSSIELGSVLSEDNNLQVVANDGIVLPGLYSTPTAHPILSKVGMVKLFEQDSSLKKYLPRSFIVAPNENNIVSSIAQSIIEHFSVGDEIILKHPFIDGNGNGVCKISFVSITNLKADIERGLTKFIQYLSNRKQLNALYLLQECVQDSIGEGSITFSIQNKRIENWGLVSNVLKNAEYFGSTNYFSYLSVEEKSEIEKNIYTDFENLLWRLHAEGVRGNIGFDLLITHDHDLQKIISILECNGLHRVTGSTMPNSFSYNTNNGLFVGIPLPLTKLHHKYQDFRPKDLVLIADICKSFGVEYGKTQVMPIKVTGLNRGYPVLWTACAGPSIKDIGEVYANLDFVHMDGKDYTNDIISIMKN